MLDLHELATLSDDEIKARARTNPAWWDAVHQELAHLIQHEAKTCQIHYYAPANPMAAPVHTSTAREIAILGGNRSSKTTTMLAEFAIRTTGHIPQALWPTYPLQKIRGRIRGRVVCNSLTDTLEPIIKKKLNYNEWNGVGDPSEGRGHWGFIPQHCLVGGTWERAYSEKYRTLRVAFCTVCTVLPHTDASCAGCALAMPRTPTGHRWPDAYTGISDIQFLSYDQELSAFTGHSLHLVGHDELPPADIYRENQLRALDVKGQIITAFTPPDEIGASRGDVTWFYDAVYEPGLPGPNKHPQIDTFVLHTEKNAILPADEIQALASRLTEAQRRVRLYGEFIHLTGVIYPIFTARESWWCAKCVKRVLPVDGRCVTCQSDDLTTFCHVVEPFEIPRTWPVVMVADPHPRKKDALGWFAVSPSDDLIMCGELEADGTAHDVARAVFRYEDDQAGPARRPLMPIKRLGDPNILTQTDDKLRRNWTMRQAYDEAGLRYALADDDMNSGIEEVNTFLKPDVFTRRPRLQFFSTCTQTIYSMQRWSWDEYTRQGDREPKERPRDRHKDFCDLVRYMVKDRPSFNGYRMSGLRHRPVGRSERGY